MTALDLAAVHRSRSLRALLLVALDAEEDASVARDYPRAHAWYGSSDERCGGGRRVIRKPILDD